MLNNILRILINSLRALTLFSTIISGLYAGHLDIIGKKKQSLLFMVLSLLFFTIIGIAFI